MNIMRTVAATLCSLRRIAVLGASLTLAACGSSQNWDDDSSFVTIGGTVSGFTGGDLSLWMLTGGRVVVRDSLGGRLAIPANGSFTFPSQIANGSDYSVVVANQPTGLTCTVDRKSVV